MTLRFNDSNSNNDEEEKRPEGEVVIRGTNKGLFFSFDRFNSSDKIIFTISPDVLDYFVRTVNQEAIRAEHGDIISENFKEYVVDYIDGMPELKKLNLTEESDTYKLLKNFYFHGAMSDGSVEAFLIDFVSLQSGLDTSHLTMPDLMAIFNAGHKEGLFPFIEEEASDDEDDSDEEDSETSGDFHFPSKD